MSDFSVFRRNELKYLASKVSTISEVTKAEIRAYCLENKIGLDDPSLFAVEWFQDENRIITIELENELRLEKTRQAKQAAVIKYVIALIAVAVILFFLFRDLFGSGDSGTSPVFLWLGLGITIYLLFGIIKELQSKRANLYAQKRILLNGNNLSFEYDNDTKEPGGPVTVIRYYWYDDSEDNGPFGALELKLENGQLVRIDQDGYHRELFTLADKIRVVTGAPLVVNRGKPSRAEHWEL